MTPAKPTQGLEVVMSLVKQIDMVKRIMMMVLMAKMGLIMPTLSIISNLKSELVSELILIHHFLN